MGSVHSDMVGARTILSTLVVILVFVVGYLVLLSRLGYGFDLHLVSAMFFALIGLLVTFGLFRSGSRTLKGVGRMKIVFGVLTAVVVAEELLLNSPRAIYGMAISISGLVLLPILAVWLGGNKWLRVSLETVALVFATRVVMSPFSIDFFKLSTFLPTIYTLIIITLVAYMTFRGISARDARIMVGRFGLGTQLCLGLGVGTLVGLAEYYVLAPEPVIAGANLYRTLIYAVIVTGVMVAIAEELLFRGLLQGSLERVIPSWQAIGIASVMFGLMHIGWMNPLEVLLAYGAGVVFGYMALKMNSLVAPMVAHGFGNVYLYTLAIDLSKDYQSTIWVASAALLLTMIGAVLASRQIKLSHAQTPEPRSTGAAKAPSKASQGPIPSFATGKGKDGLINSYNSAMETLSQAFSIDLGSRTHTEVLSLLQSKGIPQDVQRAAVTATRIYEKIAYSSAKPSENEQRSFVESLEALASTLREPRTARS